MRSKALALGLICFTVQAHAHLDPYLSFGLGAVFPSQDIDIKENSSYVLYGPTAAPSGVSIFQLSNVNWENELQTGFETNLIVGIHLPHHLRLEGEFLYQNMQREMDGTYDWVEYDSLSGERIFGPTLNTLNKSSATVNVYSLLSNLAYDFKNSTQWTPFLAAGFGIAWINSDSESKIGTLYSESVSNPTGTEIKETSPQLYGTAFAWQVKAGLNYAMNPNLSFDLVYRLFVTSQFEEQNGDLITNSNVPRNRNDFYIPQNDVNGLLDNSLFLNFRYTFR